MPDPYLTAAAVKERKPRRLATGPTTDTEIGRLVARFEEIAEDYLGVAYRARSATYTGRTDRRGWLELPHRQVTACTLVDELDNALVVDEIETDRGRVLLTSPVLGSARYGGPTFGQVTATYTHGYTTPPELLLDCCATYVEKMVSIEQAGQGRDVLSRVFEGGAERYSTPNKAEGRPTGFLQVDADLNSLRNERPMVW